jgi:hypothetical protein
MLIRFAPRGVPRSVDEVAPVSVGGGSEADQRWEAIQRGAAVVLADAELVKEDRGARPRRLDGGNRISMSCAFAQA